MGSELHLKVGSPIDSVSSMVHSVNMDMEESGSEFVKPSSKVRMKNNRLTLVSMHSSCTQRMLSVNVVDVTDRVVWGGSKWENKCQNPMKLGSHRGWEWSPI